MITRCPIALPVPVPALALSLAGLLTALLAMGDLPAEDTVHIQGPGWSQTLMVDPHHIALVANDPRALATRVAAATPDHPLTVVRGMPVVAIPAGAPGADVAAVARVQAAHLGAQPRALLHPAGSQTTVAQATILDHTLVVRLLPGVAIGAVIAGHPVQVVRQAAHDERSWILAPTATDLLAPVACARALQGVTGVEYAHPVLLPPLALQGTPTDPLFPQQYHLSDGGIADVDVSTVWNYVTGNGLGRGVAVTVVDSGMEPHPDLGANLRADLGYSYRESQTASLLGADDSHGEFVGGLIAAQGYNGLGGVGVAPRATIVPVQVVGTRLSPGLQQPDAVEAALTHLLSPVSADPTIRTWISNNSWAWGPGSQGAAVLFPSWATALYNGIHQGRCGRGIVYCFAAGNNDFYSATDPTSGHNANYDQWVSNRRVLAVGAIDETAGQGQFFYSQSGCGLFCVAPGGNTFDWRTSRLISKGIVSLDRTGTNGWASGDYTAGSDGEQGTSFAAPLVAGVVALVLEANPLLTYRDVMHLIANHAVPCDISDAFLADVNRTLQPAFRQSALVRSWKRWQSNGAVPARNHSVRYGFGRIAAAKAVRAAHSWVYAPASATPITAIASIPVRVISDATATDVTPGTGQATITVAGADPAFAIEHVELHVQVTHPAIGQLSYLLTSPSGSTSFIERRPNDAAANLDYTFTSVAHWGETPNGTWQLRVYDWVTGQTGTLENASLTIHGHLPYPTPTITAISPATLPAGSASVAITLTGSGFARNAANEVVMTTIRARPSGGSFIDAPVTWVSDTQVTALLPASWVAGRALIEVVARNPDFNRQFTGMPGIVGTPMFHDSLQQQIILDPPVPVITSPATVAATVGAPFAYTIAATNSPTTFGAAGLPTGWTLAASSGVVTGTPGAVGTAAFTVSAANSFGSASTGVTVTIQPVPPAVVMPVPAAPSAAWAGGGGGGGGKGCGLGGIGLLLAGGIAVALRRRR